ncbi:hypothetical protein BDZ94DRAFT_1235730 [Collybia nuda]|uniref:Uncharacterized protein n=1 Tax=Collybia nuda TaxID=64659 RepID=A0A9P5Y809_9AGAR|nr:hypothetical protein BDZ94DRAFT_1235730 [Collybia nuda]
MDQASGSSNLINEITTNIDNPTPVASSSNAIGVSSSETITSSATLHNGKNKPGDVTSVPTRLSERIANSQQNRPNVNTNKQTSNLPTLPEEDITVITEFTDAAPPVNPRKHARVQNPLEKDAANKSPAKKKGSQRKGQSSRRAFKRRFNGRALGYGYAKHIANQSNRYPSLPSTCCEQNSPTGFQ